MDEIYSFGYWVRRRRKALDLTQAALAREVGCATVTIRKIETDERRPSRVMADRLAECLGVSDDEREAFILSGLGEVSAYRMPVPSKPISIEMEEEGSLKQEGFSSTLIAGSGSRNNLPAQATPFIGRINELTEIRAKLAEDDCRLLTLLGLGGCGKTRLAIEAAEGLLEEYQHGIFFVSLAPVQSVEFISSTIAAVLGFSFFEDNPPDEHLLDYLRNKQMLLILDNFEHLLEGACLVLEILNAAPGLKILVTSRSSLAITGEYIYSVMGMAYPGSVEPLMIGLQEYSAVKLFMSSARRRQPTFELSDENLLDVVRICTLVDGMPLGIILAASWVMMLTPAEIAAEIAQDLAFLETELRDIPRRQRNLYNAFNYSWRLLSEGERETMRALSVFRGGFTWEAAQKVADASLSDLMGLIDKSFLYRSSSGRYEVHELLRQYIVEKLIEYPAIKSAVLNQHSETYCMALANWEIELQGPQQGAAMEAITLEIENIHSAWAWAIDRYKITDLLRAINGLCLFYDRRNQFFEGEKVCRSLFEKLDAMESIDQPKMTSSMSGRRSKIDALRLRVRTLSWQGHFNHYLGNINQARELISTGLNLLAETTTPQETYFEKAMVLLMLSSVVGTEARDEAIQYAKDSLISFKSLEQSWWVGQALDRLGDLTLSRVVRKQYFEESLAVRRRQGDLIGTASSLKKISFELVHKLQFEEAEHLAREALSIYRESDDRPLILGAYGMLSSLLVWQGKFSEARFLVQENLAVYKDIGSHRRLSDANAISGFPDLYLGAYEQAYNQAKYSLSLCREIKDRENIYGSMYAIDILGKVALAKNSFVEAEQYILELLPLCQRFGWMENEAQAWACLGYIARETDQRVLAKNHFYKALGVAVEEEGFLALIHTLPGISLLYADQGEKVRAVELYALAATQGFVANSKWFDDIAGDEIAAVAEGLPVELVEVAKVRGRSLDLWETAAYLLNEFKQI